MHNINSSKMTVTVQFLSATIASFLVLEKLQTLLGKFVEQSANI